MKPIDEHLAHDFPRVVDSQSTAGPDIEGMQVGRRAIAPYNSVVNRVPVRVEFPCWPPADDLPTIVDSKGVVHA